MSTSFSAARMRESTSFRRLTGISVPSFDAMVEALRPGWDATQSQKDKPGRPLETGGLEDHLLIYDRCYVTQEFLGYFYAVNRGAICRAIKRTEALVRPLYGLKRDPKGLSGINRSV